MRFAPLLTRPPLHRIKRAVVGNMNPPLKKVTIILINFVLLVFTLQRRDDNGRIKRVILATHTIHTLVRLHGKAELDDPAT